jgi:hypothetical protein
MCIGIMDLIKEFKHLPSQLGIEAKKSHFVYLDSIIKKEINKYSEEMQDLFKLLMISFQSNMSNDPSLIEIRELFISNSYYRNNLESLINNIKISFNFIN